MDALPGLPGAGSAAIEAAFGILAAARAHPCGATTPA